MESSDSTLGNDHDSEDDIPWDDIFAKENTGTVSTLKEGDVVERTCGRCEETFSYQAIGPYINGVFTPATYYSCPSCKDALEQERLAESINRAREDRMSAYELVYENYSDFGARLAKATVAGFQVGPHNRAAFAIAREWFELPTPKVELSARYGYIADPIRPNLIIVGPIGSGKSYLAACVYRELRAKLEPVLWINAGTLISQVRRGFSEKDIAKHVGEKIAKAGRAHVLVMDDLGKVHPGKDVSWIEEQFYALVDERYRNELPTIVTTEWKSEALAGRVGESVVSRLMDGAKIAGIKAPATAYRKPA